MKLTRRGYAALAVVAGAFLFAWTGDPGRARSLNAVAAPVLAAVLVGAVTVHRADAPTADRTEPSPGFPGETRTVELTVTGSGVATITDGIGEGLSGSATVDRTLPATVSYDVTYESRGVRSLGGTSVRVRDVLGLVEEQYRVDETTQVLVYPHVYSVGDAESFLRTLGPENNDRSEFDRLREYVPGDSLRDVHWKTSAKHDDLLVAEFTDPLDEEAVTIAASCAPGHADEMATAAATLFVAAVQAGLSADLAVPGGRLPRGYGETHKQYALEQLARTGSGDVPEAQWEDADVRIYAAPSGVTITVDDQRYSLDDLTATRDNPVRTEVAS